MQFCQRHWDAMRSAVDARGMSHLVARTGKEALENDLASLQGRPQHFDPLMSAHWAILNRVLARVGLAALGDICPLCEVQKSYDWWDQPGRVRPKEALDAQGWIDSCMDAMRKQAVELGLVPGVQ